MGVRPPQGERRPISIGPIIFCVDTYQAPRLRQAIANERADLGRQNPKYVISTTDDGGGAWITFSSFIDPSRSIPVIVTASRPLCTGSIPDGPLIVLDREGGSIAEFKQIVGRGAGLCEDITSGGRRHCHGYFGGRGAEDATSLGLCRCSSAQGGYLDGRPTDPVRALEQLVEIPSWLQTSPRCPAPLTT